MTGPRRWVTGEERQPDLTAVPWRTGRKLGRTIYAMVGPEPSDYDILIGVMDTPELAHEAVVCHNAGAEA